MFPDSQIKMRNHLIEEVLNSNMFHVTEQYKKCLGDNGKVLDGTIDLLGNTSKIVENFQNANYATC